MSVDSDSDLLAWTVDTILREHAPHPLALIRQSSCVWLLCLLKHASSHPCIQVYTATYMAYWDVCMYMYCM